MRIYLPKISLIDDSETMPISGHEEVGKKKLVGCRKWEGDACLVHALFEGAKQMCVLSSNTREREKKAT